MTGVRLVVGGVAYLAALHFAGRAGLFQYPTPTAMQFFWLLMPGVVYGLVAASGWALVVPVLLALFVRLTVTTGIENSDSTWGEALWPVILVPSAVAVGFGVLLSKGLRELLREAAD